ncbi:MAG: tetratricopeptide repeat protein [Bacteroidota bacterium]
MYINRIIAILITLMVVQSCATSKLTEEGETAYQEGNYEAALSKWEQHINEKEQELKTVDSSIYFKAGKAAWELDQSDKAQDYLESADNTGYASPELYLLLSRINKNIDNLTLEIEALENYHEKYPEGEAIRKINIRLFETYVESEQWAKAEELWPSLPDQVKSDLEMKKDWFKVNKKLENDEKCNELASQILDEEPENLAALEWNAIKYFKKADDLYMKVMKDYNESRSRENYNKLLEAWDVIWPDFKTSRDYFEKLYELEPKPRYANYLGHIYKRMDKDQKAEEWYKKAE